MVYLGIDLGGSKTAISLAREDETILLTRSVPSAQGGDFSRNAKDIFALIDAMLAECGLSRGDIAAIGMCSPGPLDLAGGRIVIVPTAGWKNVPLRQIFTQEFGVPFALENDAAAAALAECHKGAGQGTTNMLYFTVSTGVGGGIIIDKKIYDGHNGYAGEFGHIPVDPNGGPCVCGGHGCLELYSSGTAIAAAARRRLAAGEKSALAGCEAVTAREVEDAYRAGDALARDVWDGAMRTLGGVVGMLYKVFAPDAYVFGGGVSNAFDIMEGTIAEAAKKVIHIDLRDRLDLRQAKLKGVVGTTGALLLAKGAHAAR